MIFKIPHIILLSIGALTAILSPLSINRERSLYNITLSDCTHVVLFTDAANRESYKPAYYLPVNLRLSQKDNQPQISFTHYEDEKQHGMEGGILHLLLTWGLTRAQEQEVNQLLIHQEDSSFVLMGSAGLRSTTEKSFQVTSNHSVAQCLRASLSSIGHLPLFPGGKLAVSFRFSQENVRTFLEAMKNPDLLDGIKLRLNYELEDYALLSPWITGNYPVEADLADVLEPVIIKEGK